MPELTYRLRHFHTSVSLPPAPLIIIYILQISYSNGSILVAHWQSCPMQQAWNLAGNWQLTNHFWHRCKHTQREHKWCVNELFCDLIACAHSCFCWIFTNTCIASLFVQVNGPSVCSVHQLYKVYIRVKVKVSLSFGLVHISIVMNF